MKTVIAILSLILFFCTCNKKKEATQTPIVVTPTPPPRVLNDYEKKLLGYWILDSSRDFERDREDYVPSGLKTTYNDSLNCKLNFTGNIDQNNNAIVEDGFNCSPAKKTWEITADNNLLINGVNGYPYRFQKGLLIIGRPGVTTAPFTWYYFRKSN